MYPLILEISNKIATIIFNRPKSLNALNTEFFIELNTLLTKIEKEENLSRSTEEEKELQLTILDNFHKVRPLHIGINIWIL